MLVAAGAAWAGGADFEQAHKLYNSTNFQQSIKVLLAMQSKDAAVYALLGRNYYMEGEFKKASEALEKSFELEPTNAEYALWLGRAFGRRAEMASPFTAPGYASNTTWKPPAFWAAEWKKPKPPRNRLAESVLPRASPWRQSWPRGARNIRARRSNCGALWMSPRIK